MNNSKGLSQILYLIIAASVLMIAALSMVFMLNEGLSGVIDFGGQADVNACERAIQTRCTGRSGATIDTPSACFNSEGNPLTSARGVDGSGTVSCN